MQEALGKNWLEVALNGPWTKERQPGIPVSVAEIVDEAVACVNAGASIVHVHAYDEKTGQPNDDAEIYSRIIGGIRSKVDAVIYPTIPAPRRSQSGDELSAKQRYAHVDALAAKRMIEWAAIDPGSINIARYDDLKTDTQGYVYTNSEEHIRHGLAVARHYALHPSFAIYEPGFARLGASLRFRESCPDPIYRLMFTRGFTFGFPPEDYGMTAYLNLLDQVAPGANWMIAGLDVDISPLVTRAVIEGGHVRVGLEDAPLGCERTNVELVEEAAKLIDNAGGALATAAEVRIAAAPEMQEEG